MNARASRSETMSVDGSGYAGVLRKRGDEVVGESSGVTTGRRLTGSPRVTLAIMTSVNTCMLFWNCR